MNKTALYLVVSISGAAILALEILGTRILGPFYGVSIYLWSALITITLAALSAGYWVGGNLADKNAQATRLWLIFGLAGLWIVLIPWMKYPFLHLAEPFGLRFAVLIASAVLFFPPLMLLGMISPFAIKLRTADLNEVGRSAGRLYALSTLASVVSALFTGFFLIPNVGVNRLTLSIGGILILTALIGYIKNKKAIQTTLSLIVLAFYIFSLTTIAEQAQPEKGLLAIRQSPYAELRVLETEEGRHLLIDGGIHTLVNPETWESYLHYAAVMELPKYFFDRTGTALVIGLGGGSLVKQYAQAFWKVDAVEIDPVVIELAYEYFGLQKDEGTVYEMDGRQFLVTTSNKYDVILLDAFGSSSIPFHLTTEEAFGLLSHRLTAEGILAINIETVGWDDPIVKIIGASLRRHFSDVVALPMEEPPNQLGNIVLLAANRALIPHREPEPNIMLDPDWRYGPGYQKLHAWDNRFVPKQEGVSSLTDDLNPIDVYSEQINLVARKRLHEYFQQSGLSW